MLVTAHHLPCMILQELHGLTMMVKQAMKNLSLRLVMKDQSYQKVRVVMRTVHVKVVMIGLTLEVKVIIVVALIMGATVHEQEDVQVALVYEGEDEEATSSIRVQGRGTVQRGARICGRANGHGATSSSRRGGIQGKGHRTGHLHGGIDMTKWKKDESNIILCIRKYHLFA